MLDLNFRHAGQIKAMMRWSLPFAIAGLCLWALDTRVGLPTFADLRVAVLHISALQWMGALCATALSFWALGRYDQVAHRHLQTGHDGPAVRQAGMAAIALAQTTGFGLLTGSFARWRLLSGLTAMQAGKLTALVGMTFMLAMAAVSGAFMVMFTPFASTGWIGLILVFGFLCVLALGFMRPALQLGRFHLRLPSLMAMGALTLWTAVDLAAAGTALWLLLPDSIAIGWGPLVTAYCLALGAAILSSSPAGVGPLELTLLALLPGQDSTTLIAALLAFRLVYYALPAGIAALCLILPDRRAAEPVGTDAQAQMGQIRRPASTLSADRPNAEAAIILQNGGHLQTLGLNQLAMVDTAQSAVALFDPVSGRLPEILPALKQHAILQNRAGCIYKCSAKTALAARNAGWRVLRIASEAHITPQNFTESGSSHRQLRRKLRQSEKAGVSITPAASDLPLDQMSEVDLAWQHSHGTARGTTMGQFDPGYLAQQEVFLAWQDGRIIGFVSLHALPHEWCLDLIRIRPDAPDGTGHALIRAAIAAAAAQDVPCLSLAAVPDHRLAHRMDNGLRRFKSMFAPTWAPRYICAPSWGQMAISMLDLIRLVNTPDPITPVPLVTHAVTNPPQLATGEAEADANWHRIAAGNAPHNKDEENEIALARHS